MKEMTKKTAVVAMAGIMAAGMLTGCGEKKQDGCYSRWNKDSTGSCKSFCQRRSDADRSYVQKLYGRL